LTINTWSVDPFLKYGDWLVDWQFDRPDCSLPELVKVVGELEAPAWVWRTPWNA